MVRSGRRCLVAALVLACGAGAAMAQQPLVITSQEPTPAVGPIPTPPAPASSLELTPMPHSDVGHVVTGSVPQAACCGAASAVATCCAAETAAPCCAAAAPVAACGCAVGAAASFAAFTPAEVYPGGPNSFGTSYYGASSGAGMGVIAAPGYGPVASGQVTGSPYAPGYSGYFTGNAGGYAGGYATAGYGSAVSGAWPTYFGQNSGAAAFEGYPMGSAAGGTAGEHLRHPFYNDRRPWYTPGPGARTVSIVW